MIVHTMNDSEILSEIEKDFPEIAHFTILKDKEYRRAVIKASRFPFYMRFYKTTKNNNRWMMIYEARGKKDRKDSRIHFVVMLNSARGQWAIMPTFVNDKITLIFFQPHFFSRYRERMKLEETGEDLFYKYFRRNYDYVYEITEKEIDGKYLTKECFGSCKDGIAMGVLTTYGHAFFKTFITYDMTKGQQTETFGKNEIMRQELTAKQK